jgi:L-serine/L-threonine ammonia-lyase
VHSNTPLIESLAMRGGLEAAVWLKMDALQPSGSFKNRGMGHACKMAVANGASTLLSSSGGNAGLAVAFAGRKLRVPVIVVVPSTTRSRARQLIESEGAKVIIEGDNWDQAHQYALSLEAPNVAYMHPFDNPDIWTGHATIIDEVKQAGLEPDAIVLSVGGGGLLCGVVEGVRRNGWPDIPVIAVETQGAASLHAAAEAGRHVSIEGITSIATTLGATRVCSRAFELLDEYPVRTHLVSDEQAVEGCLRFLDDHRIVVEPACGASLFAVYDGCDPLRNKRNVLVIVCGGAGTTVEQLHEWQNGFA